MISEHCACQHTGFARASQSTLAQCQLESFLESLRQAAPENDRSELTATRPETGRV
jgi:hypothetical protein